VWHELCIDTAASSAASAPAAGRMTSATRLAADDAAYGIGDVLGREAEILEQRRHRRRFAEAVDADARRARSVDGADVLAPAIRRARFDRDSRNTRGQHV